MGEPLMVWLAVVLVLHVWSGVMCLMIDSELRAIYAPWPSWSPWSPWTKIYLDGFIKRDVQ